MLAWLSHQLATEDPDPGPKPWCGRLCNRASSHSVGDAGGVPSSYANVMPQPGG